MRLASLLGGFLLAFGPTAVPAAPGRSALPPLKAEFEATARIPSFDGPVSLAAWNGVLRVEGGAGPTAILAFIDLREGMAKVVFELEGAPRVASVPVAETGVPWPRGPVVRTGQPRRFAGESCSDVAYVEADTGETLVACFTPDGIPLTVRDRGGQVLLEITALTRAPQVAGRFAVPANAQPIELGTDEDVLTQP
jgi:hypothetical protein